MNLPAAKPDQIGRYEIISIIGRGGMGTVYLATDPRIGRSVAIKVLSGSFGHEPELLARLYREAKSTGGLQHPNIVTVYELGDQDGYPYLVMEYLEGEGLEAIIAARKPLPITEKLDILIQVCSGLNYAHKRGVIHRDIKPANIVILKNGTPKIVDFGIAQVGTSRLTQTGMVVGSIHYMSPEQVNGKADIDSRTDLYSTGVVLFQLLTGVLPFEGHDTGSTLMRIVHDPPPLIANLLDPCPAELESIIQKALAKNRDERYSSADDLAFDLTRLQQQLSRDMLADHLAQATRAAEEEQFDEAKRLLMQALRADSQNVRAKELLREVQWKLEVKKRRQQAQRLLSQAKEAFQNQRLDTALRCVDEGLNINASDPELQAFRAVVVKSGEDAAKYRESLNRAELACEMGDLTAALRATEEALAIQPSDPRARSLQVRITCEMEERARQEKAAESARQLALVANKVEKAIAGAEMQMFLGQKQQAMATLDKVADQLSEVSVDLREQWQTLRQEILKRSGPAPGFTSESQGRAIQPDAHKLDAHKSDIEFSAGTSLVSPPPPNESATRYLSASGPPYAPMGAGSGVSEFPVADERGPEDIPEELTEFLPKRPALWRRVGFWVVIAAVIVALAGSWVVVGPKLSESTPFLKATSAEINAEPWGTVKEITSADGTAVAQPNEQTPLRVLLPPGRYTVSISGPNGEQQQLQIEIRRRERNSYFVVFAKPDIDRILSAH